MKNKKELKTFEVMKKERKAWGQVKPVTTVEKSRVKDSKFQRKNKKKLIDKAMKVL